MESKPVQEFAALFRKECFDRSDEIDPGDEYHWESLALGWAIARGMDIEDAKKFAYCI